MERYCAYLSSGALGYEFSPAFESQRLSRVSSRSDTSLFSSLSLSYYSIDSSFILNLDDFEGIVPATSLASGSSGFGADSKA